MKWWRARRGVTDIDNIIKTHSSRYIYRHDKLMFMFMAITSITQPYVNAFNTFKL